MNEQKWFTCAEFNEKTAANHRKHQAEKAAILRHAQRHTAAIRRQNRLIVLDLSLAATALTALGVLIGCMVG